MARKPDVRAGSPEAYTLTQQGDVEPCLPAALMRAAYFARGFGRTWNFTTFGRAPLPPSWCHGVYIE